jgi:hypothetical protein
LVINFTRIAFAKCNTIYILFHDLEPVLAAPPIVEALELAAEVPGNLISLGLLAKFRFLNVLFRTSFSYPSRR